MYEVGRNPANQATQEFQRAVRMLHLIGMLVCFVFAGEYLLVNAWVPAIWAFLSALVFVFSRMLAHRSQYYFAYTLSIIALPSTSLIGHLFLGYDSYLYLIPLILIGVASLNRMISKAYKLASIALIAMMYGVTSLYLLVSGPVIVLPPGTIRNLGLFNLLLFVLLFPSVLVTYSKNASRYKKVLAEAQELAVTQQLARTVAHEIRQPLAALTMVLDLVDLKRNSKCNKEDIEMIRNQVVRIDGLVKKLLKITDLHEKPYPTGGTILELRSDEERAELEPAENSEDER